MTAMRINSRIKFFAIGLCVFILCLFSLKVFNSSKEEFEHLRTLCEQQQSATSEQIKVVVEQKLRIENTLTSERKLHQQTKDELQKKIEHEKQIHEESISDTNLRFTSLQQHFKLTKSQLEDLTADCAKSRETQNEEINSLNQKIKSLQSELLKSSREKEKEIELWKAKLNQLQTEKSQLELLSKNKNDNVGDVANELNKIKFKNTNLEHELYRANTANNNEQHLHQIQPLVVAKSVVKSSATFGKSFNHQISVSEDLYKIPIKINNNENTNHQVDNVKHDIVDKTYLKNGGDGIKKTQNIGIGIINSVENFQMIPRVPNVDVPPNNNNVLQQPVLLKTSTASNNDIPKNKKTSESEPNKLIPALAIAPTMSSTTKTKGQISNKVKLKLPQGVPPPPQSSKLDEEQREEKFEINRYASNVNSGSKTGNNEKNYVSNNNKNPNSLLFDNGDEQQESDNNNAHEDINNQDIVDIDKNNINNHRHYKESIHNNNNDAAEEDLNLYDNKLINNNNNIVQNSNLNLGQNQRLRETGNRFLDVKNSNKNDKLLNEIVGDHGKEYELEDDMPMDGQNEAEEDQGDVGEYDDPKALKIQGPAERN